MNNVIHMPRLTRRLWELVHWIYPCERRSTAVITLQHTQPPSLSRSAVSCCCHCCALLQDSAAGESVSPAVGTYAHTFSTAVMALLPGTPSSQQQQQQNGVVDAQAAALSGTGLPELLLMSHHPAITAGLPKQLSVWHKACSRLHGHLVPHSLKGEHNSSVYGAQHVCACVLMCSVCTRCTGCVSLICTWGT